MCNINTGICLQSFENVLCHFEPTISWLLSTYCNRKKLYFHWEPQERQCVCVCVCVQYCVLGLGREGGGSWCWSS